MIKNLVKSIGFAIVFLLVGYLLNPFNKGFLFGYPLLLLIVLKKTFLRENLDLDFFLLLLLSFIYAAFFSFDPLGGSQYIFIYALFPPIFYLMGKYLSIQLNSQKTIFGFLFAVGFVFSFSALISVFMNFLEGGFAQFNRSLPLFWNDEEISATKMAAYFTLNMCIPAILIGSQGKFTIIFRVFAIAIFVLSLICVIRLGSRTQLGIMLITSIAALFYVIPKQSFKKNIALTLILMISTYLVYRNVSFDLNADWLSTFAGRMEKGTGDITSGGGRTDRWVKSIENIFKKPLGWSVGEFGHAHNLWFDVLRVSGIIPFILLLVFSVRSFLNVKKAIKSNSSYFTLNISILTHSVAFFLVFMVEPIYEGMFPLFVIFCMFMGIYNKYRTMQPLKA